MPNHQMWFIVLIYKLPFTSTTNNMLSYLHIYMYILYVTSTYHFQGIDVLTKNLIVKDHKLSCIIGNTAKNADIPLFRLLYIPLSILVASIDIHKH